MNPKTLCAVTATGILSFAGIVVETAMNVAFPTLMQAFHVSTSAVQWLTTGYLLVLALVVPTSSFLKRSYPTKRLFIISNILFIFGTIAAMAAPSFQIVLLGRLIQGIGTGIALPLMFNIIVEQVPLEKTGTVMGFANLIIAIAPAVGPTFGGFIVKTFGWRMIFVALLPLLVISLVLGMTSIVQGSKLEKLKFDFLSWIFLLVGFSSLIFATNQAASNGWLDIKVIILLVISFISLIMFYFASLKRVHSLIRIRVLKNWRFNFSMIALMISQFSILSTSFLLPNFAQLTLHQNAFVAGLLLLPGATIGVFLTLVGGKTYDLWGARKPIIFGFVLYALATLMFCILMPQITSWMIVILFTIAIIGQAFSSGNTMTNGLHQVKDEVQTDANAILNTVQQLSGALGTSIVATIVSDQQRLIGKMALGTMNGVRLSFGILCLLQLIAIILIWFTTIKKKSF